MESIVISHKTKDEAKLITDLLQKMNNHQRLLLTKEDTGLLLMMEEADVDDTVSKEEIMQKLKS